VRLADTVEAATRRPGRLLRLSTRFNWPVVLFITLSPLVAAGGAFWWVASGRFNGETIALALLMAVLGSMGITAGYHRLFSHRSYEAGWPLRSILLLFGAASFEESALQWCHDHRAHHRYVDRDGDPYNIRKGFWFAHFGWMFRSPQGGDARPADLWNDPLVRFQHRFYLPIATSVGLGLPLGIASLWGDPWGGLLIAGFLRIVVNHHLTFAINSVCHTFGSQPYSDRHSARDHWLTAFFTYGEGYHNFHHEFPSDYRNGHRPYHWDPTKWLVRSLAGCGLATHLRTNSQEAIRRKRTAMQKRLAIAAQDGRALLFSQPARRSN
jgi:stearoyl-CoA desaturase (delta-9 desaturase)